MEHTMLVKKRYKFLKKNNIWNQQHLIYLCIFLLQYWRQYWVDGLVPISEVSIFNKETKQVSYPDGWVSKFGLGEYFAIRILHEQACTDILYDQKGYAIPEKMDQMLREIDMGIWDNCLFGSYEMYQNAKAQRKMSTVLQSMAKVQQQVRE